MLHQEAQKGAWKPAGRTCQRTVKRGRAASNVMGDRTGTPGDVGLPFLLFGSRGTEGLLGGLASMITAISLPICSELNHSKAPWSFIELQCGPASKRALGWSALGPRHVAD